MTSQGNTPIIVIAGATGTGKSELSLAVAEHFISSGRKAEIVNADAMQLYRGMNIGTAKLSLAERRGIPHHMIDLYDVNVDTSVADYQPQARAAIESLSRRGVIPILVGGSGLYLSSVIFDFQFPARDEKIRAALEKELNECGAHELFLRLCSVDPEAAKAIGPHNARRIVRALEVVALTGKPLSGRLPDSFALWRPAHIIVLDYPRQLLVQRLDQRVEQMWRSGLVEEVRGLATAGLQTGTTAQRAIGYAQALAQIEGTLTETEAIAQAQSLTRRYARRQVSWFKRYPQTHWLPAAEKNLLERACEVFKPEIAY